jgi:DNA end-binding protein Ku
VARTIWNGTLTLGAIAIPVGIAPTVRDGRERFRRLHEACGTPVSLRPYCTPDEQLLEPEQIVSAYEVAPGEFLVLDQAELDALEPEETREIPIGCFVGAGDLDPLLEAKRYRLAPSKTVVGGRAYTLLAAAMHDEDAIALARFSWKGEKIAAIRSRGTTLELTTLHFDEDLVPVEPDIDPRADVDEQLRALARELVQRHTRTLQAGDLASLERPRVRAMLEDKLAGQTIIRPQTPVEPAAVSSVDLADALQRSLKTAPRPRRARRKTAAAAAR